MPEHRSRLQGALGELQRRHVIRTLGGYAVASWLVLQVADVVLPAIGAPAWVMTALVAAVVIGAPVAAMLAWFYDLTPDGIHRTDSAAEGVVSVPALGGRGIDYVIIGGLVLILCFVLLRPEAGSPEIGNRVAVLPFDHLGSEADAGYVGDGVAEAVIDQLARIPGIQVSGRTSSFSFRDTDLAGPEIARRLDVDTLLEGSVRRAGERLRISARLVHGETGKQLWGDTFDGTMSQGFELQDKIAAAVAQVMRVQLGAEVGARLETRDGQAYDEYLLGRARLREGPGPDIAEAMEHFRVALRLDPDFGLAAAGLCRAGWERYEFTREPALADQARRQCEDAARRYPQLAETRIGIGSLLLGTGKPEQAEAEFRAALEREPHNAEALAGLSRALLDQGRIEPAVVAAESAVEADPAYWRPRWELGILYYYADRLDEAETATQAAIRLNPDSPDPYILLGGIHTARGEFLKAADAFERSLAREPTPIAYSNAGTLNYYLGHFERAEVLLKRALEMNPRDFRYSSFLAWAIEAQPDSGDGAVVHHNAVVRSATDRLAINENDFEARAALALHLAALGHTEAARGALASLPPLEELNGDMLFDAGMAQYLLGNTEAAAENFEQALRLGRPAFFVQQDPRLAGAWTDRHFRTLANSFETTAATGQGDPR